MYRKDLFLTCAILVAMLVGGPICAAAETPVPELITALKSSDDSARQHAADHLAAHGAQAAAAVTPLTALLKDPSAAVRAHAAHALGQIGAAAKPSVPALVMLVKDSDPLVRGQAVKAVLAIRPGPQVTVPLCVKLLEESDPSVQHRILQAISAAGEQAVPGLIEALDNPKASYWACIILRDMGPKGKAAIPALVKRLQDPRPEIRREAVLALGAMGNESASVVPQIAALISDEHAATAATYALGRIGRLPANVDREIAKNSQSSDKMLSTTSLWATANTHPEDKKLRAQVTEQLIGRLSDADPYVRVAAARGLAALPPASEITLPIWEKALLNADEQTLAYAVDALSRLGAPAVPHLANALKYESLRPHVVLVLQELGPDAAGATPALAKLIDDADDRTAHSAILTLAKIGPGAKAAAPALVKAIQNRENPNAHAIAYTLGRIGPAASDARETLMDLLGGSNQDLALISAWALTKIDRSPAVAAKVVPVFVSGLGAASPVMRRGAAESLGEMGTLGKSAASALERAQNDRDASVRDAAKRALARVQGSGA